MNGGLEDGEGDPPPPVAARNPRYVSYADYKPKQDFTSWLAGYESRIQYSFSYGPNEQRKIREEVVKTIPGKLAVGSALDAYNHLTPAEKNDYNLLVKRLSEEFTDPKAKREFNANMSYNVRKKDQSVQDYAEEIKKDMDRYSHTPATVWTDTGARIKNPERESQGVRRFKEGIRDEKGKVDDKFYAHLAYHLQDPEDLNWKNALAVASRFEATPADNPQGNQPKSNTATAKTAEPESESSDEEEVKCKTKTKKQSRAISAIADQVHENQMRITKLETAQERTATALENTNSTLQEISAKLDLGFAQGGAQQQQYQPRFQQQPRLQQQQSRFQGNYYQPRSQQQQFQLQQQQQQRARQFAPRAQNYYFRPQNSAPFNANPTQNTWVGRNNQQRQGNFGFNRRTPSSFPTAAAAGQGATAGQNTTVGQSANKTTVAAMDEPEIPAEELCEEAEEDSVTVPMSQFLSIATQAGIEIPEDSMVAGIEELNFY